MLHEDNARKEVAADARLTDATFDIRLSYVVHAKYEEALK